MSALDPSVSELPADVLDRPAQETARWLALVRLHELDRVRPALDHVDPDGDALHDFRVALRRLRSTIRAFRAELDDTIPGRARRQLARLAHATAPSRDADVHLAWLSGQEADVTPAEAPGVAWLRRRLGKEKRASDRALRRELQRDFRRVSDRLHDGLTRYVEMHELGHDRAPRVGRTLLCEAVHGMADELDVRFDQVHAPTDERELHRARIAGKRLRYGLESLLDATKAGEMPPASAGVLLEQLKELQDQLGDIHDAHVFGRWLADRAAEAGARRSRDRVLSAAGASARGSATASDDGDPEPGIAMLERRLHDRAARRYTEVCERWSDGQRQLFLGDVHTLASEIGGEPSVR